MHFATGQKKRDGKNQKYEWHTNNLMLPGLSSPLLSYLVNYLLISYHIPRNK